MATPRMSLWLTSLLFLTAFVASTASAAQFLSNDTIMLGNESVHMANVYAAGNDLSFSGEYLGDIIAAGSKLALDGSVAGDVTAAGAELRLAGTMDDIRAAGSAITISGTVNGDLIAFGSEIAVANATEVLGDARLYGSSLEINGTFYKDVVVSGASVAFNGVAMRNLTIDAEQISFGPNARIEGDLIYVGKARKDTPADIVRGTISEQKRQEDKQTVWEFLFGKLEFLFMILISGYLLLYLFKPFADETVETIVGKPLHSLLLGLGLLVAVPIVALLLIIPLITLPLTAFLAIGYALALWLGFVFAGIVTGRMIFRGKEMTEARSFTIGALVFVVITLIPIVKGMLYFVAILFSLGGIGFFAYKRMKQGQERKATGTKKAIGKAKVTRKKKIKR